MINRRRCQGLSLLELSIVLIVIGLIAGLGISLGSNLMNGSDRVATQQRLITIRNMLDAYAKDNGFLPCPASREDVPTDANFGVERRNVAGNLCAPLAGQLDPVFVNATADQVYMGALPIAALGLPASYAADAWGNKFLYVVSARHVAEASSYAGMLTGVAVAATSTTLRLASNASATDDLYNGLTVIITSGPGAGQSQTISDYNGANKEVTVPTWSQLPNNAPNYMIVGGNTGTITIRYGERAPAIANYALTTDLKGNPGAAATYVLISHGPNGLGAFPLNSTMATNPCMDNGGIDFENCNQTDATFYDAAYNDGSQSTRFFDDYLVWGTNANSRAPLPNVPSAGVGSNCSPGVCDAWCARCKNAPVYTAPTVNYVCSSKITSNNPCEATCTYAYFGAGIAEHCN